MPPVINSKYMYTCKIASIVHQQKNVLNKCYFTNTQINLSNQPQHILNTTNSRIFLVPNELISITV